MLGLVSGAGRKVKVVSLDGLRHSGVRSHIIYILENAH